jgi:signal transduction histidine kinase
MNKIRRIYGLIILVVFTIIQSFGLSGTKETKNVLLINSYHRGYLWTDSLATGIIQTLKLYPEITLYIEDLNSKQFGQSHFEFYKTHFQNKYSDISFDGILTTDNDALDFTLEYNQVLFQNAPVVFTGISNPDFYTQSNSQCYGLTETVNTEYVLDLVQTVLPAAKRLLVLTDHSTTGDIYRQEFRNKSDKFKDFKIIFPEVIDLDSIFEMVKTKNLYDAIYYVGIGVDQEGRLVDFVSFLDSVSQLVQVPLFANDPIFNGMGIVGGMHQSGIKQGIEATNLLVQLMDSTSVKPEKRYFETHGDYFFDQKILDKYNIPKSRIPKSAKIINSPESHDSKFILGLISVLVLLFVVVLYLSDSNRRTRKAKRKISLQFNQIQTQNDELAKAYDQLGEVISELENANSQLKETNLNLTDAKKKAEESDNLKSAFLANVSHEIRTPLNSIVGFSSLLSEPDLSEETRNGYMELIESNSESLLVLIDEIIDLSKIEAQQLTLKMQTFSIDALMSELLQMFTHNYTNPKVELRMEKVPDSKELIANSDRVRIKQVFINLLSNACKFTDTGFIEFGYREHGVFGILLYVKDTGIGISREDYQTVFHRFRKLNENSGKVFRGTGLGLAITQKLVELLGGKIWIESELGKGSTFYFTLENLELKDTPK